MSIREYDVEKVSNAKPDPVNSRLGETVSRWIRKVSLVPLPRRDSEWRDEESRQARTHFITSLLCLSLRQKALRHGKESIGEL